MHQTNGQHRKAGKRTEQTVNLENRENAPNKRSTYKTGKMHQTNGQPRKTYQTNGQPRKTYQTNGQPENRENAPNKRST